MIIPVRCFTCGKVLADKWRWYEKRFAAEAEGNQAPPEEPHTIREKTEKGKALDELGLDRICCRRHMLGNVDLMDII